MKLNGNLEVLGNTSVGGTIDDTLTERIATTVDAAVLAAIGGGGGGGGGGAVSYASDYTMVNDEGVNNYFCVMACNAAIAGQGNLMQVIELDWRLYGFVPQGGGKLYVNIKWQDNVPYYSMYSDGMYNGANYPAWILTNDGTTVRLFFFFNGAKWTALHYTPTIITNQTGGLDFRSGAFWGDVETITSYTRATSLLVNRKTSLVGLPTDASDVWLPLGCSAFLHTSSTGPVTGNPGGGFTGDHLAQGGTNATWVYLPEARDGEQILLMNKSSQVDLIPKTSAGGPISYQSVTATAGTTTISTHSSALVTAIGGLWYINKLPT